LVVDGLPYQVSPPPLYDSQMGNYEEYTQFITRTRLLSYLGTILRSWQRSVLESPLHFPTYTDVKGTSNHGIPNHPGISSGFLLSARPFETTGTLWKSVLPSMDKYTSTNLSMG